MHISVEKDGIYSEVFLATENSDSKGLPKISETMFVNYMRLYLDGQSTKVMNMVSKFKIKVQLICKNNKPEPKSTNYKKIKSMSFHIIHLIEHDTGRKIINMKRAKKPPLIQKKTEEKHT